MKLILNKKEGIGSLTADEQASLLTCSSLRGLASPFFRRFLADSLTINTQFNRAIKKAVLMNSVDIEEQTKECICA
jgi:adenine-specific DNA methylase